MGLNVFLVSSRRLRRRLLWSVVLGAVAAYLGQAPPGLAQPQPMAWRSLLYPADWSPGYADSGGRFLHDFSYAGYHASEAPIPAAPPGASYDVTSSPYNADPSGQADATAAIQAAIDDAGAAGGGIVLLPAGTYLLSFLEGRTYALRINRSGVVLRGAGPQATRLMLVTPQVRGTTTIKVVPDISSWTQPLPNTTRWLASDIDGPTTVLPLDQAGGFSVGDWVVVTHDTTDAWNHEHNMDCASFPAPCWTANAIGGAHIYRKVVAVNAATITLDAPTRYYLRTRDQARVYRVAAHLEEVGIEKLSIGEQEHPGECVKGNEQDNLAYPCNYETHNHDAILFQHVVNSWVRDIASYAPPSNPRGYHLLSDGIVLRLSRHITIQDTDLRRPQNRGGGGNGYPYIHQGNDNLIQRASAHEGRHNFSFKTASASGNVITNSYAYRGSLPSDFHMHLSHANLVENVVLDEDRFEAGWRPFGDSGAPHGVTGAQNVFWNLEGRAPSGSSTSSIKSDQFGSGLVIGTRGAVSSVDRPVTKGRTEPQDYLEGEAQGEALVPQSLHADQLARRLSAATDAAPTLRVPAQGATLDTFGTTLQWSLPTGATQYHLQVTPHNGDGPGVHVIADATSSFVLPPPPEWYGLLPDMTYTWRVRATDSIVAAGESDGSWGSWSTPAAFRTPRVAASAGAVEPPPGAQGLAREGIALRWGHPEPAVFYFEIQMSPDPTFNTDQATATASVWSNLVHGGIASPINTWQPPPLEAGRTYYWRVRPRVQGDGTPLSWPPAFSFTVS